MPGKDLLRKIKLRKERYSYYVLIPKDMVRELALQFQREIYLDKRVDPKNPFNWEIRLRPKVEAKPSDPEEKR